MASRKQPSGLPIFGAAAALLVGRRSMEDILPPRAFQQRQISGNASLSVPVRRNPFAQRSCAMPVAVGFSPRMCRTNPISVA